MALTTGDLQAIQRAIDASAQTTKRDIIDYMDGRFDGMETRIDHKLDQLETRMHHHMSDVAQEILGAVQVVTDGHERRITRLEHRRAA